MAHFRNFGGKKILGKLGLKNGKFAVKSLLPARIAKVTIMGWIISHRIDCNGVGGSERPAAHTHKN